MLLFTTHTTTAQLYSSGNNVISGNRVGIGTNQPSTVLAIKPPTYNLLPNSRKEDPFKVEYWYNCSNCVAIYKPALFVKFDGNIGIHTDDPQEKFHVNTTIRGGETAGALKLQTDFGYLRMGAVNSGFMHFNTDLQKFYFDKPITISGGVSAYSTNDLLFQTNSNIDTRAIIKSSNGYFGIGTTNPSYKLDVNGNGRFTSTLTVDGNSSISGKVQIGDKTITSGTHNTADVKLTVDGHAIFKKVIVTQSNWADFVFAKNYKLKPLAEVESYIKENKHLPDVPSETEVIENGISLGDMDAILLQKIEELTLYMIQLEKQNQALQQEIANLKK